jgi:leucyl/phenylalanyl-tRNA--protein transferase
MRRPYPILPQAAPDDFPPLDAALEYPDGLLAIGGDLSPARLLTAYRRGIFPWYNEGEPILWWSPNPRLVLFPEHLKVSRSLAKRLRNGGFSVTLNQAFASVIRSCAHTPREGQNGTWITPAMERAYLQLRAIGRAHSVECWHENRLVGGLYGVAIGRVFFGESMFSHLPDASKVAFARAVRHLQAHGYELIDCQVHTPHLESLGAMMIPRSEFKKLLDFLCDRPAPENCWRGPLTE